MTIQNAFDHFVAPMRRRFSVPAGMDQDGFLGDLAESLSAYTVHQLQQAAEHFRDNRTVRVFPTIAECRQAAERFTAAPTAAASISSRQWMGAEEERTAAMSQGHARVEAFRLCRCELGLRADREGWLNAMIDFCEVKRRLPNREEIVGLRRLAQRNEDAVEKHGGQLRGILMGFRRSMHERARADVFGRPEASQAAE